MTIPNFVLSRFFSDIQPIKERGKQQVSLYHQYIYIYIYIGVIEQSIHIQYHKHTHIHIHTHTQCSKLTQTNTYFCKLFEERGRVCVEQRTRSIFNPPPPPPPPPQVVPIQHANRLRKSTWQTKENSVNSAFGEGTRRCFSFVNSSGPTQTGCRRSCCRVRGRTKHKHPGVPLGSRWERHQSACSHSG